MVSENVLINLLKILDADKLKTLASEMSEYEVIALETRDEKIGLCESLLLNLKLGMTE